VASKYQEAYRNLSHEIRKKLTQVSKEQQEDEYVRNISQ
jgi:hypothetical protein